MHAKVPQSELNGRMQRFRVRMDSGNPDWELAIIFSTVNHYYFTGTIQDGMLLIPRDGEAVFWVRRSYARAVDESCFPQIPAYAELPERSRSDECDPRNRVPGDRTRIARSVPAATEIFPIP